MTDNMGRVMSVNPSAQCPKSKQVGETLQTVLKPLLGNALIVSEIVLTEHGQLRLSVWRQNGQRILWRIDRCGADLSRIRPDCFGKWQHFADEQCVAGHTR